ncbi:hypothetical protein V1669_03805 [Aeromonas enteropelogenes]|uniref:hypothetical protein n=1 Tax=Aeromonas enteropelogenes TaxID=29489 RepID=UPI003135D9FF
MKTLISQLDGQPFCILVDARDYEGGTNEALEIANDFNGWLNKQKLVAKAHIAYPNVLLKIAIQRLPELQHQTLQQFQDPKEGLAWLDTQLQLTEK